MATKTLTKEQWQQVKAKFKIFTVFLRAEFLIDGYKVLLTCEYIKHNKLAIACYVDGHIKGQWFTDYNNPHEIAVRFFPTYTFRVYSPKKRAEYKKIWKSEKQLLKYMPYIDKTITQRKTFYSSIAKVRKVFETNNDSIELLEIS
jgi:hypothetical protein